MSEQDNPLSPVPVPGATAGAEPVVEVAPSPAPGAARTPARRGLPGRVRINSNAIAVMVGAFVLAFVVGSILMVVTDPAILPKWGYFFSRPTDALSASGHKIAAAYKALWQGSLGSWSAVAQTTSQATPLICAGLGVGLAFRSGLFNIGAQGQAIWGAILAAWVGFNFHSLPMIVHLPFAIVAGIAGGALWAGIAGVLKAKAGAHEVIVTIMLNYIATGALTWLLTTKTFMRPGHTDPISPVVDWNATLPRQTGSTLHLGFLLALCAAVIVWWLLEHTRLGFTVRAVGANPHASATAGMSVARTTIVTMLWAGALSGLAGVMAAVAPTIDGTAPPLSNGIVGSVGFDAITVALLGRSRPVGIVLAGLLFGAMQAGGLRMQSQAGTPMELATVLQALIVLFVAAPMLVRTLLPFLKVRKVKRTQTSVASTKWGVTP